MKAVGIKVLFLCLVALTVFTCKKEEPGFEELLVGKWILTDKIIDNVPATLSDCEKQGSIEFLANSLCILHNACMDESTNSGWSYKDGMLNISRHLPAAYYIELLDDTSLKIRRNDITPAGSLQVTVTHYSRGID